MGMCYLFDDGALRLGAVCGGQLEGCRAQVWELWGFVGEVASEWWGCAGVLTDIPPQRLPQVSEHRKVPKQLKTQPPKGLMD
jgi:hypothetical protein